MMSATSKSIRLERLFNPDSGRTVMIAMEHGMGGFHPGLERPEWTLERLAAGRPDGILITPGLARRFPHIFAGKDRPSLVLSLDLNMWRTARGGAEIEAQRYMTTVEEAIRLGADAVKLLLVMGRADSGMQTDNMGYIAACAEACSRWNIPLIVEPTLWGHAAPRDPELRREIIADSTRIAVELGADIVKIENPGDKLPFVTASCPVPVTILGGAKTDDAPGLLRQVAQTVKAGARGVVFGRNVWQHPDPAQMVRALCKVVHEEDEEGAVALLKGEDRLV